MDYQFITSCISDGGTEDFQQMMDTLEIVDYEEVEEALGKEMIKEQWPIYNDIPITLETDYGVMFDKGIYKGRPVYVITHSAIEHIYGIV